MWPVPLSSLISGEATQTADTTAFDAMVQAYLGFGPLDRFAIHLLATLVLATVVIGLFRGSSVETVRLSRRSPIISTCIGVPLAAIGGGFVAVGYLISSSSLGVFFGVPMVVIGLLSLSVWTTLGFVAVGSALVGTLGWRSHWPGVLVGSVVSGVVVVSPVVAVVVGGLIVAMGTGAGVRVLFGFRGSIDPGERVVPPANKI